MQLDVGSLRVAQRQLGPSSAQLAYSNNRWHGQLQAEQFAGDVEYHRPSEQHPAGLVFARLERLEIPASDVEKLELEPQAAPTNSGNWPALDIRVENFTLADKRLGQLSLLARQRQPGSWSLEPTPITGRWMIYMGRFDDQDTLDKKRAELRARKVDFDRAGGTLEPGLSLGRFSTEEAAQRGLTALNAQGVRTARVIQERQAATGFILKLPAVTDAQRQRWLATLRPAMAGKTLGSCS